MSIRYRAFVGLLLGLGLLLTACSGGTTTISTMSGQMQQVSIGLGYLPDIQFAPFYVAQSKGYYKAEGLDVTFHNGIVPDLIGSMAAGQNTFVFAGGDQLLVARGKNIDAIDVGTIFQKFPVCLIVPADSPIKTLSDIKGHVIGIPGPYDANYTGLLALLYREHLTIKDITLESINFTQVEALLHHRVEAAMGYINNEPLQLRDRGMAVRTFDVSDYLPVVSDGILTMQAYYHSHPQQVKAFMRATLKGVQDVITDPEGALKISESFVPNMNEAQAREVLMATIPLWQSSNRPGYNDPATWVSTEQFLLAQKLISAGQDVTQAYTNQALE